MSKKEKEISLEATPENLRKEIRLYHRDQVLMLLKQNVLGQISENEKPGICRSIVSLRNLPMMDYVVKDVGHLKAADLKLDFEVAQNRVFIAELLKKYRKSLDFSTKEDCAELFELACEIDDDDTVKYMIRQNINVPDYKAVSCMATDAFRSVSSACKAKLSEKDPVGFYEAVSTSKDAAGKMDILLSDGYDLTVKNGKKETVLDLINKRVKANKYPNNKDGAAAKVRDRKLLHMLNPEPEKTDEAGDNYKKKRLVYCIIGAAVIVCCIAAIILIRKNLTSASSSDTSAASSETSSSVSESAATESGTAVTESGTTESAAAAESGTAESTVAESAAADSAAESVSS